MGPTDNMGAAPQGRPQESMGGAVPQAQAMQGPAQGQKLSPEELDALRNDPEIAMVAKALANRDIDMTQIPDDLLSILAGMVHKLGAEQTVSELKKTLPPQFLQSIQSPR